jgi:hypothetical protein
MRIYSGIYSPTGVDDTPYTTLDSPKPPASWDTSMGIKQIAPSLLFHKFCMVIARCHVLGGNEDQL